jgi:hypothetical protein
MEELQAKEQLLHYINQRISLNEKEQNLISNEFQLKQFKNKEFYLEHGRPNRLEAFVVSGTFRVFHIDNKSWRLWFKTRIFEERNRPIGVITHMEHRNFRHHGKAFFVALECVFF